jgi:Flp pilus assembly protein TadD
VAQQQEVRAPLPAPPELAQEATAKKSPELPAREEPPKLAVSPPKVEAPLQAQPDKKARKARTPELRVVEKTTKGGARGTVSKPEKVEETSAPVAPSQDSTIIVKRMANERIMTNYNNAVRAAEQGNSQEAKRLYLAVLADQPGNIEALNNLGVMAMREENTREAAIYFRRILEYRRDYAKAYNNLGIIAMRDGEGKIAEEYLRKAIEAAPEGAEAYLNLAALLRAQRRLEEANRIVDTLLGRGVKGAHLYLSAALIKDDLGRYEDAIKFYRYYLQATSPKEDRRKVVERLTFLEESISAAGR